MIGQLKSITLKYVFQTQKQHLKIFFYSASNGINVRDVLVIGQPKDVRNELILIEKNTWKSQAEIKTVMRCVVHVSITKVIV